MAIQKWKTERTDTIFEHPRLTLLEDTVTLPDGNTTTYLKFKHTGDVATIIAVHKDGRVLLEREYSHPPAEILYQLPGGVVPAGEDLATGANRELMEECSLRGDIQMIGSYYVDNRRSNAKTYVFVATNLQDASLPGDAEEFIENSWFTEDEVDAMVVKGDLKQAYILATWAVYKAWKRAQA